MNRRELILATSFNKKAIEESIECGCYTCISIHQPEHIKEYTDDESAVCPNCFQVTVIPGEAEGSVEYDYLEYLNEHFI
ncbi:hypothetical protein AB2B38_005940 [Balneola sp. MJW-20]|uniref:hypothetical protein n=1 Tax=Gracilimonas aurantiaca TaxID=3234185 RepID=UPI00346565D3